MNGRFGYISRKKFAFTFKISEGCEADKSLDFPAPLAFSRNRELAQTAGDLSFPYVSLAKRRNVSRPPGRVSAAKRNLTAINSRAIQTLGSGFASAHLSNIAIGAKHFAEPLQNSFYCHFNIAPTSIDDLAALYRLF